MEEYIRVMTCFVGMIVAAISLIIISRVRASEAQKWTNSAIWSLLIYDAANYIKPWYDSYNLYISLQVVIYVSTLVAGLSFGFAMLEFCEIKMPDSLRNILMGIAFLIGLFFCTIGRGKLWYGDSIVFYANAEYDGLYDNIWSRGPLYYVVNGLLDAIIIFFIIFILVNLVKRRGRRQELLDEFF